MAIHFNGLCMVPGHSWHAKMEMEHWVRYLTVLPLADGRRVLDVASGEGYGSDLLAERAQRVYGVDVSESNVLHATEKYLSRHSNLDFLQADAAALPMANRSLDLVVSFETLEHLEEPEKFLDEIRRVLAMGGGAMISTPMPNPDPATKRPRNPHHVHEFEPCEFEALLRRFFPFFALGGQSAVFPCELHDDFDASCDSYMIGLIANEAGVLRQLRSILPSRRCIDLKQELTNIHRAHEAHQPRSPRIVMVPLGDVACTNPADHRRIELVRRELRKTGYETAVVSKEEAITIRSPILLTQNRDYSFWNQHADQLRRDQKKILFSCSDLLVPDLRSQAHSFDSFVHKGLPHPAEATRRELAKFLSHCAHVFAGSDEQADH